jgi:glycosyltransferase involved in cell wall biosynthesis
MKDANWCIGVSDSLAFSADVFSPIGGIPPDSAFLPGGPQRSDFAGSTGAARQASMRGRRTSPLNIAHITDSMEMGGAEKLTAMLCRLQRDQGHKVTIHCLYLIGVLGEELKTEGFDVILHRPRSLINRMRSLYAAFKHATPDVLHCHNATAAIIGAFPARLAGVRTVIATRHGLVRPPYQIRRELKFALACRWCDWIVGVCEGTRTNLLGAPFAARNKIIRIYNGAPAAKLGAVPRPKVGFTLLYVGRLAPPKDHATLLRAVALARAQNPNVQLWIVGDGPLKDSLGRLSADLGLSECVTFFGEQTDVSPFLAAADLFVMSSNSEGLPVSLLEAMSAGLPSVVTDVGGMGEIARLSGAAIVIPPSNPSALAEVICEGATKCGELANMGQIARRCYEQNFTPERMLDDYMRLYNRPTSPN